MNQRMRSHVREVLPLVLICILLFLFCLFSALEFGSNAAGMTLLNHEQILLDHEGELIPANAPEPTRLSLILPEEFARERTICFFTSYQEVQVKLNGSEIYAFQKPEGAQIMKAAPSCWNIVQIPAGNAASQLDIVLTTPYPQYAGILPQLRSGTAEQVDKFVVMSTVPRLVAALAILFIGLVFAVAAAIMRYYLVGNTGLYSLSLFIIMLAVFLVAQQTSVLMKINAGVPYILVQNAAFMLCPLLYTCYLMRVHEGALRTVDLILHIISAANVLFISVVQIIGAADMPQLMLFTRILCGALIVYGLIQELQKRRRLLVCLAVLLLIYAAVLYYLTDSVAWVVYAALFGYLYLAIYRVIASIVGAQARQIRLQAQLEVSRSEIAAIQITSHFFYHTLDSIRALIRLDGNQAYKMTGDFAKYIRHRVDGVERMQETVPFSRELRAIRAYTDIKQAQLGERFEMIFDVESDDFEILPLTVQPLVENAVIHAVQRRSDGGKVWLICREKKDCYHIQVMDNGPGSLPQQNEDQKQSSAIKNVNTRLEFYGIAPVQLEKNELGGMTASLFTPKKICPKGSAQ